MPPFPIILVTAPIGAICALAVGYFIARFQTRKSRNELRRIGLFQAVGVGLAVLAICSVYGFLTAVMMDDARGPLGVPGGGPYSGPPRWWVITSLAVQTIVQMLLSWSAWRLAFAVSEWATPQGPLGLAVIGMIVVAPIGLMNTPLPGPAAWAAVGAAAGLALGFAFKWDFAPDEGPR